MTSPNAWTALPDSVWYTRGLGAADDPVAMIESRLHDQIGVGSTQRWARHDLDHGKTVFDALWTPQQNVLVRARLQMTTAGREFYWGIVAEATAPWDCSWDSPALLFFPRDRTAKWDGVPVEDLLVLEAYRFYRVANLVRSPDLACSVVRAAAGAQSEIHVLTTDDDPPAPPVIPLAQFLPRGLIGRVIEHRILPTAIGAVNDALRKHGLRLPGAGALVLPQRLRAPADEVHNLTVPTLQWGAGRPQALVDAVVRHSRRPRLAPPGAHQAVTELRTGFSVATDAEAITELEEELQGAHGELEEAHVRMRAATARLNELREALARATGQARAANTRADDLATQLDVRGGELDQARAEIDRLRQAATATELGRCLHAAEARANGAEVDLEAAEDLLEQQAREINWLRGRLRTVSDRPHEQVSPAVPALVDVPRSWDELQERASRELNRVVLSDIATTVRSLRGHPLEDRWRARAWQALHVLHAYACAVGQHGPERLPHLSAYLDWHDAPAVLPRTWYAASESQSVLNSARLRGERIFPVPRDVDPSGRVLMTEHIRIGAGNHPAPRMHLYDGTARTGLVYVGYLGEHLRLRQTN